MTSEMTARSLIVTACASLVLFAPARAQEASETPPSTFDEARWSRAIETVARAIDGTQPTTAMAAYAWPYASIVPFGRNRAESFRLLPERMATATTVVSARAYAMPAVSAASDLIADLEASNAVPPAILKRLVPPADDASPEAREAALRKANQTMARWLAISLEASAPGTPVGVIVCYDDGSRGNPPTLWFALVRGHVDATGAVGVSRILYGPMSAATR